MIDLLYMNIKKNSFFLYFLFLLFTFLLFFINRLDFLDVFSKKEVQINIL